MGDGCSKEDSNRRRCFVAQIIILFIAVCARLAYVYRNEIVISFPPPFPVASFHWGSCKLLPWHASRVHLCKPSKIVNSGTHAERWHSSHKTLNGSRFSISITIQDSDGNVAEKLLLGKASKNFVNLNDTAFRVEQRRQGRLLKFVSANCARDASESQPLNWFASMLCIYCYVSVAMQIELIIN